MGGKRLIPVAAVVLVLLVLGIGYWLWSQKKETGVVETAKSVSESVPEIQTNPGQEVPEINPLDRANPFKYNNPLK
ncbi:hypothetical protein A3A35_01010 [Candidatus Kaiserbacteria bacterium RIFCSPLOWO2_01_FULL_51_21]|uniref:Uncharacterized protein n=1 Tax=Candidatus Kaiserbacteria bacterium RIFCSPLOWO2_01_FULL_51_21 TaxID=1798508 RepID=A0A1F6EEI4_9BACT|nr:MAG: hypothetical protein A3A35_01010 [Candidatus Kaiserbacteria bacterium RIFCSPLOWO2_01_FULL_51_21]